jgi:phage gp37-like protein
MHEFEQLEDTLSAKLEPLKTSHGLRTLEPYAGQLSDAAELERMTARFPAIYTAVEDMGFEVQNRALIMEIRFGLIIGDRHVRGPEDASRGDGLTVGVYALLEQVRQLIHNTRLLDGWTPASVQSETPIIVAPRHAACVFGARYRIRAKGDH